MEARRYYPLLDGQEYDLMVGVFVPIPNINCLDCRFDLQEAIDEAKLLEAICLTGKRLPYLRVRLHEQEDGSVVQYIGEDEPETVNTYDVNESEVENVLLQWRDEAFDNNGYDVQLYCFRVIRKENGLHTLYLKISHFIMDGYAIMYTVRYLMRVYSALMNHTALPEEEPLPWKLLDEEKAYRGSAREEKDARWWRAQFKTEPCFTSVNGKGSPEFVEGKRYGREPTLEQYKAATLNLLFPKEFVTKVSEFAAERHISQQVFYMLAIRSFLGRVSAAE